MQKSESIAAIAAALAKAQAEIKGAIKDSLNPHYKNKYADLGSVWDACRGPLSKNNIAVVQGAEAEGGIVKITTMLIHSSGEWLSSTLTLTAQQATAQGVGGAITYGRRYLLASMVGVAQEDDDGETASRGAPEHHHPEPVKAAPTPSPEQAQRALRIKGIVAKAKEVGINKAHQMEALVFAAINRSVGNSQWTPREIEEIEAALKNPEKVQAAIESEDIKF